MARKQVGMVDDALLALVDAEAERRGQTRRVFTERALEAALSASGVASEPRSGAQRVANGSDLATAAPGPAASPRTPAGTVEQMVAPSPSRPPASERAATMLGRGSPSPFTPPIPKKLNEAKGKKR